MLGRDCSRGWASQAIFEPKRSFLNFQCFIKVLIFVIS
jgi:hypothetical protein